MEIEIQIEVVSDAEFALDLVGEGVEEVRWPFVVDARPYDWQTDGLTEPETNQGVDHEGSRVDLAFAGRYHDYGVGCEALAA